MYEGSRIEMPVSTEVGALSGWIFGRRLRIMGTKAQRLQTYTPRSGFHPKMGPQRLLHLKRHAI